LKRYQRHGGESGIFIKNKKRAKDRELAKISKVGIYANLIYHFRTIRVHSPVIYQTYANVTSVFW
jgi:hypothetical protein